MPFRCTTCQYLSREDDNPQCENRKNCNFQRVEVIHLQHADGIGRVVGSGSRTVMEEDKAVETLVPLKLCCESTAPNAHSTEARFAATCIDCLENMPEPQPQLED
jgi:hypothetical protein